MTLILTEEFLYYSDNGKRGTKVEFAGIVSAEKAKLHEFYVTYTSGERKTFSNTEYVSFAEYYVKLINAFIAIEAKSDELDLTYINNKEGQDIASIEKAEVEVEAKAKAEAEARAKAEVEAKAKAEARAKAEAEAKAKAEAESERKALTEDQANKLVDECWDLYDREQYVDAYDKVRPLAEAGNAKAQNMLGLLYYRGKGVNEDNNLAYTWLCKAVKQEYIAAYLNLGNLYYECGATDEVRAKAYDCYWYYRKYAKKTTSQRALQLLQSGMVAHNEYHEIVWKMRLAELGETSYENDIDEIFCSGKYYDQRVADAFIEHYKKRAENNDMKAMELLRSTYRNGTFFITKDEEQADIWEKRLRSVFKDVSNITVEEANYYDTGIAVISLYSFFENKYALDSKERWTVTHYLKEKNWLVEVSVAIIDRDALFQKVRMSKLANPVTRLHRAFILNTRVNSIAFSFIHQGKEWEWYKGGNETWDFIGNGEVVQIICVGIFAKSRLITFFDDTRAETITLLPLDSVDRFHSFYKKDLQVILDFMLKKKAENQLIAWIDKAYVDERLKAEVWLELARLNIIDTQELQTIASSYVSGSVVRQEIRRYLTRAEFAQMNEELRAEMAKERTKERAKEVAEAEEKIELTKEQKAFADIEAEFNARVESKIKAKMKRIQKERDARIQVTPSASVEAEIQSVIRRKKYLHPFSEEEAALYIAANALSKRQYLYAIPYLEYASSLGNAYSAYALTEIYMQKEMLDYEKAEYWAEKALDMGHKNASELLKRIWLCAPQYYLELVVSVHEKDVDSTTKLIEKENSLKEKAYYFYVKTIALDSPFGFYWFEDYFCGQNAGLEDLEEACYWARKAEKVVGRGWIRTLSYCYEKGRIGNKGIEYATKNQLEMAVRCFKDSILLNQEEGFYNLAVMNSLDLSSSQETTEMWLSEAKKRKCVVTEREEKEILTRSIRKNNLTQVLKAYGHYKNNSLW